MLRQGSARSRGQGMVVAGGPYLRNLRGACTSLCHQLRISEFRSETGMTPFETMAAFTTAGRNCANFFGFPAYMTIMKAFLSALLASQFCVWSAFAQQSCKSTVVGDLHIARFQSKMYGESFKVSGYLPGTKAQTMRNANILPSTCLTDKLHSTSVRHSMESMNCRSMKRLLS